MPFLEVISKILDLFYRHRGKTLGALTGLIISILFLTLGIWKTFFIAFCCTVGYLIGHKIDNREDFREIIDRILPPHE